MSGEITINLHIYRLVASAIIIAIAIVLLWVLRKIFKHYREVSDPNMKDKRTWTMVVYSLLRVLVVVCAVVALLSVFGVNVTGAVTGLGIAGAGAVLAVQDLLKDLIMGVTIATEHYFSLGDVVEYDGYVGKVTSLTTRSTKIQSLLDGSVRSISNHHLTDIKVLSHLVNFNLPLPYDLPHTEALAIVDTICTRSANEVDTVERCVSAGANVLNDSSIGYLIMIYCDPVTQLPSRRAVLRIAQEELAKANIQIPFPQIDVHTKD